MKQVFNYLSLFFGFYVIAFWVSSSLQFIQSYYQLGYFDASVAEFLIFVVPIFTPFITLGALLVSSYIKRLRLYLWMRKNLAIVEYDIEMPPAETGIVIDYFFGTSEVIATLLDLHFRKVIKMDVQGESLHLNMGIENDKSNLSAFEKELLNQIFKYEKHRSFSTPNDKYLKKCGKVAHKKLVEWANENDSLMRIVPRRLEPFLPYLQVLAFVGFLISIVSLWMLVFDYEAAMAIGPNTYPVHPIELYVVYGISFWGLIILLSSFWPRFSSNHKSKPVATWVKAYGLKMFLKTVYTNRFSMENISQQSKKDVQRYVPYMIALNLSPSNFKFLKQILVKQ